MSRQIGIAMDSDDERQFLEFLREYGSIRVFRDWSPSPTATDSFDSDAQKFWIHNEEYPWEAAFEDGAYNGADGRQKAYFRLVTSCAPFIEYSRHPIHLKSPPTGGRLYWTKEISRHQHQWYDLEKFDRWMTAVMRWVRKRGQKMQHGYSETWFLPGALKRERS